MSKHSEVPLISSMPKFKRLVLARNRWRFFLTALTLLCHAFFIGGVTVYRGLFAKPIADGATLTVGLVSAASVIVFFVVLEFVYIFISARKLDPLQTDVLEEAKKNV